MVLARTEFPEPVKLPDCKLSSVIPITLPWLMERTTPVSVCKLPNTKPSGEARLVRLPVKESVLAVEDAVMPCVEFVKIPLPPPFPASAVTTIWLELVEVEEAARSLGRSSDGAGFGGAFVSFVCV